MTNYNERLDRVLCKLTTGYTREELLSYSEEDTGLDEFEVKEELEAVDEAKQALTSLIKELVAEAKPEKKSTEDYGSWEEGHRNAGWNNCLKHYEQNLLKALEEVS